MIVTVALFAEDLDKSILYGNLLLNMLVNNDHNT
jgi:hypothetical protein